MTRLRLRLFGGFEARDAGGRVIAFPRKRAEALLAFLALGTGQTHSRSKLAALLWADAEREQARHSLRQVLVSLRQCLDAAHSPALIEDGEAIAVHAEELDVDVLAF